MQHIECTIAVIHKIYARGAVAGRDLDDGRSSALKVHRIIEIAHQNVILFQQAYAPWHHCHAIRIHIAVRGTVDACALIWRIGPINELLAARRGAQNRMNAAKSKLLTLHMSSFMSLLLRHSDR
jgi:hypothetical protein